MCIEDSLLCTQDSLFRAEEWKMCIEDSLLCTQDSLFRAEEWKMCIEDLLLCMEDTPIRAEEWDNRTEDRCLSVKIRAKTAKKLLKVLKRVFFDTEQVFVYID